MNKDKKGINKYLNLHSHKEERFTISKSGNIYTVSGKDDGTGKSKIILNAFDRWWELPSVNLDTTKQGINAGNVGGASNGNKIFAFWDDTQTEFVGYGLLTNSENPSSVYQNYKELVWFKYQVPIGSIIAWHKSFSNTPPLSDNWVECNGQTLSDSDSPFDGQTIPDLNGDERFLRGSSASGTNQNDLIRDHLHRLPIGWDENNVVYHYGNRPNWGSTVISSVPRHVAATGNAATGAARIAYSEDTAYETANTTETRPKNMSVVWIMRVK